MTRNALATAMALLCLAGAHAATAAWPEGDGEFEAAAPDEDSKESRQEELYEEGTDALDEGRYDRAVTFFAEAAKQPGERADGALYWQAYALSRLGRGAEALATLAALKKRFPQSRWNNDATALELELKGGRNLKPESVDDEELKLIALNSLLNSDAERAI